MVGLLWLIPFLPLLAAGVIAVCKRPRRRLAAGLAIGAMGLSCLVALAAFVASLQGHAAAGPAREYLNFSWFEIGSTSVKLGWVLDPLTALMAVMVTFVGSLIFIYSAGYMASDENFTRFFGFLSLFAAAMLGLVIANSLLLLFICWELVGLTSYLLIGFWFHKPSAAAAAKKAFITTRVGDLCFFVGMLWLYSQSGTLLFYDHGAGCLEKSALEKLAVQTTFEGLALSTVIGLLLFGGAVGKSGQVPLHVWLPDAMEGPTPVSALIHAATMVAAGVFLMARVYPILTPDALTVIAWVGAITAVFAALIAVAQTDIKRILAYSTVSQLGYMMMALGVGGYVAGVFHLITHAFFKALLFMGAGSVIHGCHEEQDIRRMGGLRQYLPATFLTYAIGMMALAGVPVFFSGFWSKDEILHAASIWPVSHGPFLLGLVGAFLTAFYMTRQVALVFWGKYRGHQPAAHAGPEPEPGSAHPRKKKSAAGHKAAHGHALPHESPPAMVWPLKILAAGAILLGFLGTPAWPWFHSYLTGHHLSLELGRLFESGTLGVMLLSTLAVAAGIGSGWKLYGRAGQTRELPPDALETFQPQVFAVLRDKFRVDEIYQATVIRAVAWGGEFCHWLDQFVWQGCVRILAQLTLGLAWINRAIDELLVNRGFDRVCRRIQDSGGRVASLQDGQVQHYLRVIGVALAMLVLLLAWGGGLW